MFHHESSKPIHAGVERSKVKVVRNKNGAGVGCFTLASAGFFYCADGALQMSCLLPYLITFKSALRKLGYQCVPNVLLNDGCE